MKRDKNPFPLPCIKHRGSFNLWSVDDVANWENQEIERTKTLL